eukprot:TRINITY_DN2801_c0_g1_i1.p1 TRINITY_DN2801_c0_g1~~TRINITY_DN2801_c0_g1_i1.p1  ORF type:complete len:394 (+),score=57.70 TRINITY_DN2801_c0_g1_i1:590-1771(+)
MYMVDIQAYLDDQLSLDNPMAVLFGAECFYYNFSALYDNKVAKTISQGIFKGKLFENVYAWNHFARCTNESDMNLLAILENITNNRIVISHYENLRSIGYLLYEGISIQQDKHEAIANFELAWKEGKDMFSLIDLLLIYVREDYIEGIEDFSQDLLYLYQLDAHITPFIRGFIAMKEGHNYEACKCFYFCIIRNMYQVEDLFWNLIIDYPEYLTYLYNDGFNIHQYLLARKKEGKQIIDKLEHIHRELNPRYTNELEDLKDNILNELSSSMADREGRWILRNSLSYSKIKIIGACIKKMYECNSYVEVKRVVMDMIDEEEVARKEYKISSKGKFFHLIVGIQHQLEEFETSLYKAKTSLFSKAVVADKIELLLETYQHRELKFLSPELLRPQR